MKSNLGQIVKESYSITIKNKWLWVFGALLIAGAGFNFFSFSDSSGDSKKEYKNISNSVYDVPGFPMSEDDKSRLQNLDAFFSEVPENFEETVLDEKKLKSNQMIVQSLLAFTNVPKQYWWFLVVAFSTFTFLMIVLGLYIKSWASCALIKGIDAVSQGANIGLKEMSSLGRPYILELIKLNIFSTLLAVVPIGVSFILIIISFEVPGLTILLGLIGLVLFLASFVFMLLVFAGAVLGKVALTITGKKWKEAFIDGFNLAKAYIVDVIALGVVNCCFTVVLTCLSVIIIVPLLIALVIGFFGAALIPPLIFVIAILGLLVFVAVVLLFTAAGAAFAVFKQSTWVLLYKQLINVRVNTEENANGK